MIRYWLKMKTGPVEVAGDQIEKRENWMIKVADIIMKGGAEDERSITE